MKFFLQAITISLFIGLIFQVSGLAQSADGTDQQTFLAPRSINFNTIETVGKGTINVAIMQTFGDLSMGAEHLWGIDRRENLRIGLEYGITQTVSAGISRSSLDKRFEINARATVIQQNNHNHPVSISVIPSISINTAGYGFLENDYTLTDRLVFHLSVPVARRVTDEFSVQLTPMITHFNRVGAELNIAVPDMNTYFGASFTGSYKFIPDAAFTVQIIPELIKTDNIRPYGAVGFDIKAGKNVFQLFFATSRALNESYLIAGENGKIPDFDFRIGFTMNRSFSFY